MRHTKFKHAKLLDVSDERNAGNPIMVTTAYGWAFDPSEDHCSASHVKGFDTVRELRGYLKWLKPCPCLRCTSLGKDA
jgi:hypothetical protein